MVGSRLFYKVGRFFGEIGGQENIYRKNLPPGTISSEAPISDLKAVPDDEVDPVQKMARSYKQVQNKQQLMSLFCCISMAIFIVIFLFL